MAKMTTKEMHARIEDARNRIRAAGGEAFRHYKGGVYKVNDFTICTTTGWTLVRYHRVAGPDYSPSETGIFFSRPLEEFFDEVDGRPRFVPVHSVNRYETLEEVKERG